MYQTVELMKHVKRHSIVSFVVDWRRFVPEQFCLFRRDL
jgi:hypothetical protein